MLVTQGMRLVAIGLALGSGLAILVVRALAPAIPGARPWDSLTYGLVFAPAVTPADTVQRLSRAMITVLRAP